MHSKFIHFVNDVKSKTKKKKTMKIREIRSMNKKILTETYFTEGMCIKHSAMSERISQESKQAFCFASVEFVDDSKSFYCS